MLANNSSKDIEQLKTQLSKTIWSPQFLVRLLGRLMKAELPLMKNVLKPLAKSVLAPVGSTAVCYAGIHKNILGFGKATLILSNEKNERHFENS